jgi:hypothetical protein
MNRMIYSKYNRERRTEYQIATIHYQNNSQKKVKKSPLSAKAFEHIKTIYENSIMLNKTYNNIDVLSGEIINGSLVYEYVDGSSWDEQLFAEVMRGNLSGFFKLLDSFYDILVGLMPSEPEDFESSEEFNRIFGKKIFLKSELCIQPANIDFIFDNVYSSIQGGNILLDCEWVFPFKIPLKYILFRSVYAFWVKYSFYFKTLISFEEILYRYDIDEGMKEIFLEMEEKYFQIYVNGEWYNQGFFGKYLKKTYDLTEITSHLEKKMFNMKLYPPVHNGYSEDSAISQGLANSNELIDVDFILKGDFSKGIPLRIDPLECPGVIHIYSVQITDITSNENATYNLRDITYNSDVIKLEGEGNSFLSIGNDPQLFLKSDSRISNKRLNIKMIVDFDITPYLSVILKIKDDGFSREIGLLQNQLKIEMNIQQDIINKLGNENNAFHTKIEEHSQMISDLQTINLKLRNDTESYEALLSEMRYSLSWRITAPFRFIGRLLRRGN